jgi:hypothetical protein
VIFDLLLLLLQGIYMLQDNNFRWLLRVAPAGPPPSGSSPSEHLAAAAQPYLELPCGIIRGALCEKRYKIGYLHHMQFQAAVHLHISLSLFVMLRCTLKQGGTSRATP